MGLDMYLHAKKYVSSSMEIEPEGNTYEDFLDVAGLSKGNLPLSDYGSVSLSVKVMYWRKANAIHNWFVNNVQDGEDNCREYEVGREQLSQLRELCDRVIKDHDLAEELLPPQGGFFFGGTELDEWYFASLEETRDAIDKLLDPSNPLNKGSGFGSWWFYYDSSW
jgi:hypothetical protein